MNMDWISTPFVVVAFSGIVFFAISCAFCFCLGRLLGKLDGRDSPGEGRRTGLADRRGPQRSGLKDPARDPATEAPAFKQTSTG